jgi:vacuolar-type H+-ATPase subunit I/STV1
LAQFSPATGKNKIKQDQEQQKAFLDYVTTTKISASVPKQNNNNNNQTKPKKNFFWLPLPSVSIVHILISHMYISDIFGFYFFCFCFVFYFSRYILPLSRAADQKDGSLWYRLLLLLLSVVLHLPKFPQPSCSIDIIRRLFGFPVTLN